VRLKNGGNELRRVPIVTSHLGFAHVPYIGDLVLIGYIGGSVNSPVILGSLYNDERRPPINNEGELVYESPGASDINARLLCLKFPKGITLTITDDDIKVEAGPTTLRIKRDGDIEINSGANLTIEAQGSASIKSNKDISFSAPSIKMECDGNLELKAGTKLTATTQGTMELKGSIVNIN
jgi:phage gp45-like